MLTDWAFWQSALDGMADPAWIVLALALTTLAVEDVAIAAGAALAARGVISWELAFAGVAGGIAAGDAALYALGVLARRIPALQRRLIGTRSYALRDQLLRRLGTAVLLARVTPGLRLLTYTACGFLQIALLPFLLWVAIAVAAWTAGLFWVSKVIGTWIAAQLQIPAPLAVALPIVILALLIPIAQRRWQRARA